ncbi:unnamed protein product [Amoebophrya sp. A25]|nr:unnamed protein product [Amoebophrya sp. A25]|eukprot:GSA25T00019159001.1
MIGGSSGSSAPKQEASSVVSGGPGGRNFGTSTSSVAMSSFRGTLTDVDRLSSQQVDYMCTEVAAATASQTKVSLGRDGPRPGDEVVHSFFSTGTSHADEPGHQIGDKDSNLPLSKNSTVSLDFECQPPLAPECSAVSYAGSTEMMRDDASSKLSGADQPPDEAVTAQGDENKSTSAPSKALEEPASERLHFHHPSRRESLGIKFQPHVRSKESSAKPTSSMPSKDVQVVQLLEGQQLSAIPGEVETQTLQVGNGESTGKGVTGLSQQAGNGATAAIASASGGAANANGASSSPAANPQQATEEDEKRLLRNARSFNMLEPTNFVLSPELNQPSLARVGSSKTSLEVLQQSFTNRDFVAGGDSPSNASAVHGQAGGAGAAFELKVLEATSTSTSSSRGRPVPGTDTADRGSNLLLGEVDNSPCKSAPRSPGGRILSAGYANVMNPLYGQFPDLFHDKWSEHAESQSGSVLSPLLDEDHSSGPNTTRPASPDGLVVTKHLENYRVLGVPTQQEAPGGRDALVNVKKNPPTTTSSRPANLAAPPPTITGGPHDGTTSGETGAIIDGSAAAISPMLSPAPSPLAPTAQKLTRAKRSVARSSDLNPINPCGACMEWLRKISEKEPSFRVITFASMACERIFVKRIDALS